MNAGSALVFLAKFFNEAAGHEILKFLVCPQAKHFLTTAYRIANFEICENALKEIVEAEYLFISQNIAEFIGDMIRKAT